MDKYGRLQVGDEANDGEKQGTVINIEQGRSISRVQIKWNEGIREWVQLSTISPGPLKKEEKYVPKQMHSKGPARVRREKKED